MGAEHDAGESTGRLALEANGLEDGAGAETYICGNPPYLGKGKRDPQQKIDMERVFAPYLDAWGYIDYVSCWILRSAEYMRSTPGGAMRSLRR